MAKRISPTQLSMNYLRKRGVPCAVTEKWVKCKTGGFRKDVFGGDLIALVSDGVLNIQAGTATHHAEKIRKASEHPEVSLWLACPSRHYWVMTWAKRVAFNKDGRPRKGGRWKPRVTQLTLQDGAIVAKEFILIG